MSISRVYSAQLSGLNTHIIDIEIDLYNGLHSFSIVGLGDKAIEESKDRISAAIKNSGYISPKQKNQKVTISLAPADIRKEGPSFDLGMALVYLSASNNIYFDSKDKIFLGELSLEGNVRKINGVLPLTIGARDRGFKEIYVPTENALEAVLVKGIKVFPVNSLREVVAHLSGNRDFQIPQQKPVVIEKSIETVGNNFNIIQGQETAKRALEISASGAHNIAMFGPPGTGKTMLAKAFQTILPSLQYEEIIEVTSIHSIARTLDKPFITEPPFRSPHHTCSYSSLIGGGSLPRPGEITLAHRGVLFLDEFPEFDRDVIEALRQPLENRSITISRTRGSMVFPAQCIVIIAMNPCPCGLGKDMGCKCSDREISNYNKKISGPIIDRIDMWVSVHKVPYDKLSNSSVCNESSLVISKRVEQSRQIQKERFVKYGIKNKKYNSEMDALDIEKCIVFERGVIELLKKSTEKLGLSARAYHRIIKLSQTIADLDKSPKITKDHVLEAIQYRQKGF